MMKNLKKKKKLLKKKKNERLKLDDVQEEILQVSQIDHWKAILSVRAQICDRWSVYHGSLDRFSFSEISAFFESKQVGLR